jgi:hypothetical protein
VAYAAKAVAPKAPLAAYFLAVQVLDVLFTVFVLSGVAIVRVPRRESLWLGLAVFSHFLLDLPVHTPDLTIAGDDTAKLGLGLWNNIPLVLALKRSDAKFPKQRNRIFLGILALLTIATPFMPDPSSPTAFAIQALVLYCVLAWTSAWSVGESVFRRKSSLA